jgi:RHS repeat-associated protein
VYDGLGRLVERNTTGASIGTNRLYYAGWQLIAEYNAAGKWRRKYVCGPGIDEPIRMIGIVGSVTNQYYYHADGLGSVSQITDASGSVVDSYRYDVYGTPTIYTASGVVTNSTAINNRLMFTARDRDPDTSWYNYRYRYYNPNLGRFVQPDPIGIKSGDMNLYAYCGNEPAVHTDPDGRTVGRLQNNANFLINLAFDTNPPKGTKPERLTDEQLRERARKSYDQIKNKTARTESKWHTTVRLGSQ